MTRRWPPQKVVACPGARSWIQAPPVLIHARALYASEIGLVTSLVDDELRRLASQHPDPAAWHTAFREAVRANVRQLCYVARVLETRARGRPRTYPPSGGSHVYRKQASRRPAGQYATDEEYAGAQRQAAALKPLDLVATLGTANA